MGGFTMKEIEIKLKTKKIDRKKGISKQISNPRTEPTSRVQGLARTPDTHWRVADNIFRFTKWGGKQLISSSHLTNAPEELHTGAKMKTTQSDQGTNCVDSSTFDASAKSEDGSGQDSEDEPGQDNNASSDDSEDESDEDGSGQDSEDEPDQDNNASSDDSEDGSDEDESDEDESDEDESDEDELTAVGAMGGGPTPKALYGPEIVVPVPMPEYSDKQLLIEEATNFLNTEDRKSSMCKNLTSALNNFWGWVEKLNSDELNVYKLSVSSIDIETLSTWRKENGKQANTKFVLLEYNLVAFVILLHDEFWLKSSSSSLNCSYAIDTLCIAWVKESGVKTVSKLVNGLRNGVKKFLENNCSSHFANHVFMVVTWDNVLSPSSRNLKTALKEPTKRIESQGRTLSYSKKQPDTSDPENVPPNFKSATISKPPKTKSKTPEEKVGKNMAAPMDYNRHFTPLCEYLYDDGNKFYAGSIDKSRQRAFYHVMVVLLGTIGCRVSDLRFTSFRKNVTAYMPEDELGDDRDVYMMVYMNYFKGRFTQTMTGEFARLYPDILNRARCPLTAVALALRFIDPQIDLDTDSDLLSILYASWQNELVSLYEKNRHNVTLKQMWQQVDKDLGTSWRGVEGDMITIYSFRKMFQICMQGRAAFGNCIDPVYYRTGHVKATQNSKTASQSYCGLSPQMHQYIGRIASNRLSLQHGGDPAAEYLVHNYPAELEQIVHKEYPANVIDLLGPKLCRIYAAYLCLSGRDSGQFVQTHCSFLLRLPRQKMPRFEADYASNIAYGKVIPLEYDYRLRTIVYPERLVVVSERRIVEVMPTSESNQDEMMSGDRLFNSISSRRSAHARYSLLSGEVTEASDLQNDTLVHDDIDSEQDSDASDSSTESNTRTKISPTNQTGWAEYILGKEPCLLAGEEDKLLEKINEKLMIKRSQDIEEGLNEVIRNWEHPLIDGIKSMKFWCQSDRQKRIFTKSRATRAKRSSNQLYRNIHRKLVRRYDAYVNIIYLVNLCKEVKTAAIVLRRNKIRFSSEAQNMSKEEWSNIVKNIRDDERANFDTTPDSGTQIDLVTDL